MENTKTTEEVTPVSSNEQPTQETATVAPTVEIPPMQEVISQVQKDINPDRLIQALYWIWDGFGRTAMPMFLVHQTAKDVIANHDLKGDKVEVGVRRTEWLSGNKGILDIFAQPLFEDVNKAQYEFEGVPIIVHVYDDDDCIMNLDHKLYRHETFKLPNPYNRFEQLYG